MKNRVLNDHKLLCKWFLYSTKCFCFCLKCTKIVCWLGLHPRPRWGSLQRSPRPPSCVGWGWRFFELCTPVTKSWLRACRYEAFPHIPEHCPFRVQTKQSSHQPGKSGKSQGKSGNLGGQGKSGKSQGILDGVREKEEKKKKRKINKRTRNKKRTRNTIYNIDIYYIIRSEFL